MVLYFILEIEMIIFKRLEEVQFWTFSFLINTKIKLITNNYDTTNYY